MSSLASQSIPAEQVFPDAEAATEKVLANRSDLAMVRAATHFLETHLPARYSFVDSARRAVDEIVENPIVTRVQHLVTRLDL